VTAPNPVTATLLTFRQVRRVRASAGYESSGLRRNEQG